MKRLVTLSLALCTLTMAWSQTLTLPPNGDNQRSQVIQWIGPVQVSILYNSPNVHAPNGADRKGHIWGELVHYGFIDQGFGTSKAAPWRAGSNENTTVTFSHDVKIGGKDLKAGTYGLFLDVEKDGPWTWIFSTNSGSWGSYFYSQSEDALRVQSTPEDGGYTEFLTYGFDDRQANSAVAFLQWENKKIGFKIEANVNDIYMASIRNELRNSQGFDYRNFQAAAQFAANNKTNLEEALVWANASMDLNTGGVEDFGTLSTKASVLLALNRGSEAETTMDKAIKDPSASMQAIHQYGRTLQSMGRNEKALEVFQYNAKKNPQEKFTTYVGLARGYTGVNNKKEAIKNWEIALKNVPEGQQGNRAVWEGELKKLKESK